MINRRMALPILVLLIAVAAFMVIPAYAQLEVTDLGYQARPLNPSRGTEGFGCADAGEQPVGLDEGAVVMKVRITDKDYPADDRSDVEITDIQVNNLGNAKKKIIQGVAFLDKDNRCIAKTITNIDTNGWGTWHDVTHEVNEENKGWTIPDDGTQILQVVVWLKTSDRLAALDQGEDTIPNTLKLQLTLKYKEKPSGYDTYLKKTSDPIEDQAPEEIWNGGFESAVDNNYNGGVLPIGGRGIVQEFTLCDNDAQPARPSMVEVWVSNFGDADRFDLSAINLYVKGEATPIASVQIFPGMAKFAPGTMFPITPNSVAADKQDFADAHGKSTFAYAIPDDSCATFQIGVVVSPYAFPGHTIQFHTTIYAEEPYQNGDPAADSAWIDDSVAPEVTDGTAEVIGQAPAGMDLITIGSPPKLPAGAEGFVTVHWMSHDPKLGLGAIQGTLTWNPDVIDPVDDPYNPGDDTTAFDGLASHYLIRSGSAHIDHLAGRATFILTYDFGLHSTPLIEGDLFKFKVRGVGSVGDRSQLDLKLTQVIGVYQVVNPHTGGIQLLQREITPNVVVTPADIKLVLLGDVDGNGTITVNDAILLANYIVDQDRFPLTEEQRILADVAEPKADPAKGYPDIGNGLTSADVAAIARLAVSGMGAASLSAQPLVVTQILAYPNPVVSSDTIHFTVEGQGVESIKVEVFNLSGNMVFDSGFTAGNTLEWNLMDNEGFTVANGVYLYVVTVRGWDGSVIRSEVHKLVVLR